MSLRNYLLRTPLTVILVDKRDPDVSWQHHLDRTGRGGVDLVAAVGTPIYARTTGWMQRRPNNGSAGNSCEFHHDDNPGWRDVFSHLSSYAGRDGQHFSAGEIVAYTGNTGGVAQHLHWHLLDPRGNRQNPFHFFSPVASPAAPAPSPIIIVHPAAPIPEEYPDMATIWFAQAAETNHQGPIYVVNPLTGKKRPLGKAERHIMLTSGDPAPVAQVPQTDLDALANA